MAVGRGLIYMAGNNWFTILSRCDRHGSGARKDAVEMTWRMRGDMQHHEHCSGEVRWQASNQRLQGLNATSRCTHNHNITLHHTALLFKNLPRLPSDIQARPHDTTLCPSILAVWLAACRTA